MLRPHAIGVGDRQLDALRERLSPRQIERNIEARPVLALLTAVDVLVLDEPVLHPALAQKVGRTRDSRGVSHGMRMDTLRQERSERTERE